MWFSSPLVAPTVCFLSGSPWNKLIVLLLPAWKFILNLENDLSFYFVFKLPKLPYNLKILGSQIEYMFTVTSITYLWNLFIDIWKILLFYTFSGITH